MATTQKQSPPVVGSFTKPKPSTELRLEYIRRQETYLIAQVVKSLLSRK
jgi:hypothetical protein